MEARSERWVLLVDDELGALHTLADVLLHEGFQPRVVSSVAMAKAVLETGAAGALVVDLSLGDGNGVELAQWAWSRYPDLPILFTSAYTDLELVDYVVRRGLPFFSKPMNLASLLSTLEAMLNPQQG